MASQQMDDSHPYMMELDPYMMMELEMTENDPLLRCLARSESIDNENDPLLRSEKNRPARSESSDMEILRRKMLYRRMKIQKVPEMFRRNKSSVEHYTPMVVSIGPYHHGTKVLDGMEDTKVQMAANFVKKSVPVAEGLKLNDACKRLYDEVAPLALLAMGAYDAHDRESWSENLVPNKLANIMLVDGCFILEFIRCVLDEPKSLPMNSHTAALVKRDLFLLENQLPFGVLISLMESSKQYEYKVEKGMEFIDKFLTHMRDFPPPRRELCRDRVSKCSLSRYLPGRSTNPEKGNNARVNPQIDTHLLGLFQKKFIKNKMELSARRVTETLVDDQEKGWHRYRSAMELKRVGIECEPAGTMHFTDIHFTSTLLGGKLKIPRLTVDESTTPLILNLVAYEAILDEIGVTSYICLMNSLIDSQGDISELRSKEILFHTLGCDEQVAKLFSDIANNLVPNPNAYSEVKTQIESHYRNDAKMWYNHYNSKIYSAIWKIVGLGTAIFGALKAFTSLGMQLPGSCKF